MYYPIHLQIDDMDIAIIGGGQVAWRRCQFFLEAGKRVRVVAKAFLPQFQEVSGQLELIESSFHPSHLLGCGLVIAATDDSRLNDEIAALCRAQKKLVNVASRGEGSDFITPAVVKRGDVILTVSTSGKSPALSAKIKGDLERRYGEEIAVLAREEGLLRKQGQGCKNKWPKA